MYVGYDIHWDTGFTLTPVWNGFRCHGESGIPELLHPHTKFPSE